MTNVRKDTGRKCERSVNVKRIRGVFCLFIILAVSCLGWQKASALDRLLYQDGIIMYIGDKISLRGFIDEEFLDLNYNGDYNAVNPDYKLTYKWNDSNINPDCASLSDDGIVTAISSGNIKIDITFTYQNTVQTEVFVLDIKEPEQVNISYGESYTLEAAEVYDTGKYMYTASDDSVVVNGDGSVTAYGFNGAEVYISGDDDRKVTVAKVNIVKPEFNSSGEARAAGTEGYIPVVNNYSPFEGDKEIEWRTADDAVAYVADGKISAVAAGETELTAVITSKCGDIAEVKTKLTVTDPAFAENDFVVAAGATKDITLTGICDASNIDWNIGNASQSSAYFIGEGKIYAEHMGDTSVSVIADGREVACNIIVTDPYYDGDGIVGYKGVTETIEIKGIDGERSKVTYKSRNKSIATVSAKGVVKAKKTGNAVIVANADGKEIEVTVEVASVKGYKASKKAISISNQKTQYSQAKRMKKGFYDCSSLVWRVYSKYSVYFGVKSDWAPTAADIGKWCNENDKVVYNKAVSSEKLLPGDLIFFSTSKNGRYKNITHVEMYTGQSMDVSASSSNNAVIHYPYSQSDSIVMIARPTK